MTESKDQPRRVKLTVTVPREMYDWIKSTAQTEQVSMTAIVRRALEWEWAAAALRPLTKPNP